LTDANNCFTNQIAGSVKMTENTFVLSNGGRIKIGEEAWETMGAGVQTDEKARESGGVMMGRFIKDCKDLVIDKVTQPMDGDRQSRYGFKRLSPLHQEILDKEWMASKGTCNYLGEWHTHPEDDPTPSSVDINDWKRKLRKDVFSGRYLYFLIVGTEKVGLWEGDRRTLTIDKLIAEKVNQI